MRALQHMYGLKRENGMYILMWAARHAVQTVAAHQVVL